MDNRLAFLLNHDELHLHAYSEDALNMTCDITSANPNNYPKLFCQAFDLIDLPNDLFLNVISKLLWITTLLHQEEIER